MPSKAAAVQVITRRGSLEFGIGYWEKLTQSKTLLGWDQSSIEYFECACPSTRCYQQELRGVGQNLCFWWSPPHTITASPLLSSLGTSGYILMMFLIHSHFSYQKKPWFSTLAVIPYICSVSNFTKDLYLKGSLVYVTFV